MLRSSSPWEIVEHKTNLQRLIHFNPVFNCRWTWNSLVQDRWISSPLTQSHWKQTRLICWISHRKKNSATDAQQGNYNCTSPEVKVSYWKAFWNANGKKQAEGCSSAFHVPLLVAQSSSYFCALAALGTSPCPLLGATRGNCLSSAKHNSRQVIYFFYVVYSFHTASALSSPCVRVHRDFLWLQNSEQLKQEKGQNDWVRPGSRQEQLSEENTSVTGVTGSQPEGSQGHTA